MTDGTDQPGRIVDSELVSRTKGAPIPEGVRPRRRIGRRAENESSVETVGSAQPAGAVATQSYSADEEAEHRFAERGVALLFILAALGTIAFCVVYFTVNVHAALGKWSNLGLGAGLAVSLLATGCGMIVWAKGLMPHEKAIQERHSFHSPEAEELEAEETFLAGARDMQLHRPLLRRTLLAALGILPIPAVIMLRDLGPLPHDTLRESGWKAGDRLVYPDTKQPVRLGDIDIGGIATVMPEGFTTTVDYPLAPTILIRFAPGQILSAQETAWSYEDQYVAYSKICTHAGCPISLYEQQTHHLLCPCRQSTFQMNEDAKVIFGPAARALPQMWIDVDDDGYFVCKQPYTEPVGPSFWERG